jgi:hypothetical protein
LRRLVVAITVARASGGFGVWLGCGRLVRR